MFFAPIHHRHRVHPNSEHVVIASDRYRRAPGQPVRPPRRGWRGDVRAVALASAVRGIDFHECALCWITDSECALYVL